MSATAPSAQSWISFGSGSSTSPPSTSLPRPRLSDGRCVAKSTRVRDGAPDEQSCLSEDQMRLTLALDPGDTSFRVDLNESQSLELVGSTISLERKPLSTMGPSR